MINYDYIYKAIIAPYESYLQQKGHQLETNTIVEHVLFPRHFIDLQNRQVILVNENLAAMGDTKKTLILNAPDNILVTSPAEFEALGISKYQRFSGFLDITTLTTIDDNNFIPYPLLFIELIAKIK